MKLENLNKANSILKNIGLLNDKLNSFNDVKITERDIRIGLEYTNGKTIYLHTSEILPIIESEKQQIKDKIKELEKQIEDL